jgi:hypothetical protein
VNVKSGALLGEKNINCKCLETKFRDNYEEIKGMKYEISFGYCTTE